MATTKHKSHEMTPYQQLSHLLRKDAEPDLIIGVCRGLMLEQFEMDIEDGPEIPHIADIKFALWTMATKVNALQREIETLKRRVRRERQHKSEKPQGELLKKEPEQPAQAT
jgi:hypothetical protein